MNKLYMVLVAGLLAGSVAIDATPTRQPALQTRLASLMRAVKRSGPASTLIEYGGLGTAWYFAAKELVKKGYFSAKYPEYISYVIGAAGVTDLADGIIPGAGLVNDYVTEVGFAGTVWDFLNGEFKKQLPASYHDSAIGQMAYFVIGYTALKLCVTYGPAIAYDAIVGLVTAVANAIDSDSCGSCPPCSQTATQVAAL